MEVNKTSHIINFTTFFLNVMVLFTYEKGQVRVGNNQIKVFHYINGN